MNDPIPPLQPTFISILTNLLSSDPKPTSFEIAILHIKDDKDNDDDGEKEQSNPSNHDDDDGDGKPRTTTTTIDFSNTFLKIDTRLGINAPDLPHLAREFRNYYSALRQHCFSSTSGDMVCARMMESTCCLLLICPDHCTAWNDRKRILLHRDRCERKSVDEMDYETEIEFMNLLFTQHSKAPSAWSHRKWILRNRIQTINNVIPNEERRRKQHLLLRKELSICTKVAESFPKNYYAWTHRLYVIQQFLSKQQEEEEVLGILQEEIDQSENWLKRHVSDHSSVHYFSEIVRLLMMTKKGYHHHHPENELERRLSIPSVELKKIRNLLKTFASHEVIWRYRRLVTLVILEVGSEMLLLPKTSGGVGGESSSAGAIDAVCELMKRELLDIYPPNYDSLLLSKEDVTLAHLHCRTYVMWVWKHVKHLGCEELIRDWRSEVDRVKEEIERKLKCDMAIVHNLWRMWSV